MARARSSAAAARVHPSDWAAAARSATCSTNASINDQRATTPDAREWFTIAANPNREWLLRTPKPEIRSGDVRRQFHARIGPEIDRLVFPGSSAHDPPHALDAAGHARRPFPDVPRHVRQPECVRPAGETDRLGTTAVEVCVAAVKRLSPPVRAFRAGAG